MEEKTMQSNRGREWFSDLLDPPPPDHPPLPPPLSRPLLIWEDGDFAYITDEFTVRVAEADPNAIHGIGKTIVMRKQKGTERWRNRI
jgi:hypothetical protein